MKKFFFSSKAVPRWVILIVDLSITSLSFALSYFIIKQFEFSEILRGHFFIYTILYSIISLIVFFLMRIHTGLIRYSNIQDMMRIFVAVLVAGIIYPVAVEFLVARRYHINSLNVFGVLLINFYINSSLLILLRTFVRGFYNYIKSTSTTGKESVLVYGSDNDAVLIKQALEVSSTGKFVIAGFIETDAGRANIYIQQKKVFHIKAIGALKKRKNISKLILMNEQLSSAAKKTVIDKCLLVGIKVLTVPPPHQWVSGRLSLGQIQELSIEDLLQREQIVINNQNISKELTGKSILITGAAGSIGSEIVRQVIAFQPMIIVLCDQAESDLHDIQLEVEDKYPGITFKTFIGSVRDSNRMLIPFREYRPDIVFHAAAYKHVPMMERHPSEAILTNVMGTKVIADLAVQFEVQKFVMISTDKAVNPTNVMGTSKRIAEMYVQSVNSINSLINEFSFASLDRDASSPNKKDRSTVFITTRFGNVLGSNGSVIPRFKLQIQQGGPVTVTHPEITRYFMTIPEAVQLVLEAATMGKGSEIFIFDMGEPVKIVDLANKMIRLTGLIPEEDIKIIFSGLRPGEKLYEELLNKEEKTLPTHHTKIKIAKVIPTTARAMIEIQELIELAQLDDNFNLVKKMKSLVPEFVSNNSIYERLDAEALRTSLPEII